MMLASVRDYKDGRFKHFEVTNFEEFMVLAQEILAEHIGDNFRPGIGLWRKVDSITNMPVGVTEDGYIVIANFEKDGEPDQRRLKGDIVPKAYLRVIVSDGMRMTIFHQIGLFQKNSQRKP